MKTFYSTMKRNKKVPNQGQETTNTLAIKNRELL